MSDTLYHRLFSHPLMVEQLVRDFVPEAMSAGILFDGMQRVNAKFYGRKNKRREGDVIWRLPTHNGTDIVLYMLLEFQSQTDWWMAVRAQVYEGLLFQHIIAEKKLNAGDRLPPVLLLVLYNGEPRWSAPAELADLIALPADSPLWPWQPQVRYHVLDMGAFPGDDLARRKSLAALLFRLEHRHEPEALAGLVDEVIGWFRQHPGYDELKRLFTELVKQAIEGVGVTIALPDDLMEIRTMLATQGEAWKRQWKAEGQAEGEARGEIKGQARSLLRLLEKRFGPASEAVRTRVVAADITTLDRWLDQVLDAPTVDAVFAEDTSH
jgi:hypothetical protein